MLDTSSVKRKKRKRKSRTWAQRQNCLEKWLNDATGRKGSSVPQGIRIKALFSLLCIVRGEVWAVIKSKQKTVRLSLRSTDLFHKEALIAVVTIMPVWHIVCVCKWVYLWIFFITLARDTRVTTAFLGVLYIFLNYLTVVVFLAQQHFRIFVIILTWQWCQVFFHL